MLIFEDHHKKIMRKLYSALCFILLVCSLSAGAQSADENAVRALLDRQSASWNRGDIEGFMKGYWENDSLMFIGKSGITYGWTNTLNNYRKHYPDRSAMGQLKFTLLKILHLSPGYIEVVGKWQLQREKGDVEGHFTLLFRKIKGTWQIIMDHSS